MKLYLKAIFAFNATPTQHLYFLNFRSNLYVQKYNNLGEWLIQAGGYSATRQMQSNAFFHSETKETHQWPSYKSNHYSPFVHILVHYLNQ